MINNQIISNKKITHIYHLADLHIRNLKRHNEYRLVFKQFLDNVKNDGLENSIIYLAGDIAHAKTEMSPELVREISTFLTECASLHEVVLIAGNHDCNLNNNHRLDVLTPIIENLDNSRIHYLRDTGTYNIHNLTFVVYSILDHKDNWPLGSEVDGKNKICLFHGPVNKSQTDVGYTVSSNSFTTELFNGFHMVMMGDIHKRQILQEYQPDKELPIVVYPGSMLQQSHGEMLEGHGYLLWDVQNRTYKEVDIHNDYGYLTVDVSNGKIPQWVYDEIDTKLPKYPRLRLRFNQTDAVTTKECIVQLGKLFRTTEITVTRTDTMSQLRSNHGLNKNIVGNVKDIVFQNQLIRDYVDRRYLLTEPELDGITDINDQMNQMLDSIDGVDNILWIPKRLEFSNMFSYGDNNIVNFDNSKGIVGIFAPNASGKSSLFDVLSFCIYDKTSRTSVTKNILNNQKDNFHVKFEFEIDGIPYFIERKAKANKQRSSVKVDVEFWRVVDGRTESLNGEQRRDTNKNIEKYLGKFEDFILTTLSLQGNNALFIDKSQSERKEILSQLIGIDIFDKLYQIAADTNKETSTLIRRFKSDDFPQKLISIESDLSDYTHQFIKIKNEISDTEDIRSKLNDDIVQLKSNLVDTNGIDYNIDELNLTINKSKYKLNESETGKQELESRYNKLIELEQVISKKLNEYNESDINEKIRELKRLTLRILEVNVSIDKLNIERNGLISRLDHFNSHKYNPECDICIENSASIISSKQETEIRLKEVDDSISEYKTELSVYEKDIVQYHGYEDIKTEHMELVKKHGTVEKDIYNIKSQIATTETGILTISNQIDKLTVHIDEYYKNSDLIEKNHKIRSELETLESKMKSVKNSLNTKNTKLMDVFKKQTTLESQKESIQERIREVKELESKNTTYEYYLNAMGKDGVSLELIEKSIPMIEGEINNILGQIVEFGMELELEGKNINANLVYGDQKWSLELCSGMERFISGLAIRIALINICNLPRPNFLVIDEGFGTLDNENLTSLYMLFSYLKTQFDFVMIISHIDSMRDVVDTLLEIKKTDGFSHVKF